MNVCLGYVGVVVAVLFFGTNYVPAKKYPTYDGILFQWFMCSGILCVGLTWGILSNSWSHYSESGMYIYPEGILGGSFWAIANLLIPTVVNTLGLGTGFMLWNGINIVMGYLVARFGLFGYQQILLHQPLLSDFGIVVMICSSIVYGFVTPTCTPSSALHSPALACLEEASAFKQEEERRHLLRRAKHDNQSSQESIAEALVHPELPNFGPFMLASEVSGHINLENKRSERKRKCIGLALAVCVGTILGNSLTPYAIWQQRCQPSTENAPVRISCDPMDFLFSQCVGIYATSTIVFLVYSCCYKFINQPMPRSAIRPAYVSGLMWGIGLAGQLVSAGNLGYSVAYPLTAIGPAVISMLWSILYFKEIDGRKNILLVAFGTFLVFAATAIRVVAN